MIFNCNFFHDFVEKSDIKDEEEAIFAKQKAKNFKIGNFGYL